MLLVRLERNNFMKNHWIKALSICAILITVPLSAEEEIGTPTNPQPSAFLHTNYSWFDVSFNYLDWSSGTENRTGGSKSDFAYLELEGGMGWDWGELYFFTDWENPGKSFDSKDVPDDARWVIKPVIDINIPADEGDWWKNFQIHIQDYYLYGDSFRVNNLILGLAYKFQIENLFIRPFLGFHYTDDNFNPSGWNGYMGGWAFNYDFLLLSQKFSLSNWNEFEFDRNSDYGGDKSADGRSWGVNGALALWWHVTEHFTTGLQYRYADHKLGYKGYQTGVIYTLKYNF